MQFSNTYHQRPSIISNDINTSKSIHDQPSAHHTLSPPPSSSPISIPSASSPASFSSPSSDFIPYRDSYSYPLSSPSFSPYAFDSPHTPPTDLDVGLDLDLAAVEMYPNSFLSEAEFLASQWLNDPIIPSNQMDSVSADFASCLPSSVAPQDLIAHPEALSMDENESESLRNISEANHVDVDPSRSADASAYDSASSGPALQFPLIGNGDDEDIDFAFALDGNYPLYTALTDSGCIGVADTDLIQDGVQEHQGASSNMTVAPGMAMSKAGISIGRAASVSTGIGASTSSFTQHNLHHQRQIQQQQYNFIRPSSSSNADYAYGSAKPASAMAAHSISNSSVSAAAPRLLLRSASHHTNLSARATTATSPVASASASLGFGLGLDTPLYSEAQYAADIHNISDSSPSLETGLGYPASAPAYTGFYDLHGNNGQSFLVPDQNAGQTHRSDYGYSRRPSVMNMFGTVPPERSDYSGLRMFSNTASSVVEDKDATLRPSKLARVRTQSDSGKYVFRRGKSSEDKDATIHPSSSRAIKSRARLLTLNMREESTMDVDNKADFESNSGAEADVDMDTDIDPDATLKRRRRSEESSYDKSPGPPVPSSPTLGPSQSSVKSLLKPPKLAPSTWQLFFTDWIQRHQVSAGSSRDIEGDRKLNVAQAAKEAGTEYKMLTEEQKEPFKRRSIQLKEQRQREHVLWQKSLSPADIKRENAFRTAQRRAGRSRKANLKDPNAPKKPLSAYFMFLAWIRSDEYRIREVFGDEKETTGQSVLAAQKWREMTDEERRPFLARAEKEKLDYEAARRLYEDSAPGIETTISFNTDDSDVNFYLTSANTTSSSRYRSTVSPSPSPLMSTIGPPPESTNSATIISAADTGLQNLRLHEDELSTSNQTSVSLPVQSSVTKYPKPPLTSIDSSNTGPSPVTRSSARRRTRG